MSVLVLGQQRACVFDGTLAVGRVREITCHERRNLFVLDSPEHGGERRLLFKGEIQERTLHGVARGSELRLGKTFGNSTNLMIGPDPQGRPEEPEY